jgi:hypothetical protein
MISGLVLQARRFLTFLAVLAIFRTGLSMARRAAIDLFLLPKNR